MQASNDGDGGMKLMIRYPHGTSALGDEERFSTVNPVKYIHTMKSCKYRTYVVEKFEVWPNKTPVQNPGSIG